PAPPLRVVVPSVPPRRSSDLGVVHVDVPETILNGKFKSLPALWEPKQYRSTEPISPTPEQVEQAAELLSRARFPMIHAGSGVIQDRKSTRLNSSHVSISYAVF